LRRDVLIFVQMNPIESLLQHTHEIEERLGHSFSDKNLLVLAFIHRSFFNENRKVIDKHNERLEFLGDSVLGLIISSYLYQHLPSQSEGHLSHLRAHLVGAQSCACYMRELDLEKFLLLGKGEAINVGKGRERILADLFEAIVGAIYLDGGLTIAKQFIIEHFSKYIEQAMESPLRNWKAELQDYSQKKFQKPPEYLVLEEMGPPHIKTFLVAAIIDGREMGQGEGSSKKQAEQAAAEDALRYIEKGEEK